MLKLFKRKKTDGAAELRAVLGDYRLPTFPAIVTSALEKIRHSDVDFVEIADLVSSDPGLSVRVLGTVNSAAFALRHSVRNIHHAVSLLGRSQLESILISMAVRETLPRQPARGYDARRFWTAAAQRATTSRALAELIHPASRSESFTAALLQDLALPILSQRQGDRYGELLEYWHSSTDDLAALESDAFGWDHAKVAGWISEEWRFPEHLSIPIAAHHGTDESNAGLPAVNLVACLREVNEQTGVEQLVERARDEYRVSPDQTQAIIQSSFDCATEIARMFL